MATLWCSPTHPSSFEACRISVLGGRDRDEPTYARLCLLGFTAGLRLARLHGILYQMWKQGTAATHQDLLDFLVIALHVVFYDVLEDILPVFKSVHGLVSVRVQD